MYTDYCRHCQRVKLHFEQDGSCSACGKRNGADGRAGDDKQPCDPPGLVQIWRTPVSYGNNPAPAEADKVEADEPSFAYGGFAYPVEPAPAAQDQASAGASSEAEPVEPPGVSDPVFRPKHYTQWPLEPFTFLMINNVPFAEGAAIKYLMRWRMKDGLQDLRKARRIIDMMIELEEHKPDYVPLKGSL